MCSLLAVLVSDFRCCFTLCLFIILLVQFGLLSLDLFYGKVKFGNLGSYKKIETQWIIRNYCSQWSEKL